MLRTVLPALIALLTFAQVAQARIIYFIERDNKSLQRLDTEKRALIEPIELKGLLSYLDINLYPGDAKGKGAFAIWEAHRKDQQGSVLMRKDLQTGVEEVIFEKDVKASFPVLSYDGSYLYSEQAFDASCDKDKGPRCNGLWRLATSGGEPELVADFSKALGGEKHALSTKYVVSSDHRRLLFSKTNSAHDSKGDQVFILDLATKKLQEVVLDRPYTIIDDLKLIGATGYASFKAEVLYGKNSSETYLYLVELATGQVQKAFARPQFEGSGFEYVFSEDRAFAFIEGSGRLLRGNAPELWQVGGGKHGKISFFGYAWLKSFLITPTTFYYVGYNTIAAFDLESRTHDFTFQNKEIIDLIWTY